jgi:hypothetical protein
MAKTRKARTNQVVSKIYKIKQNLCQVYRQCFFKYIIEKGLMGRLMSEILTTLFASISIFYTLAVYVMSVNLTLHRETRRPFLL